MDYVCVYVYVYISIHIYTYTQQLPEWIERVKGSQHLICYAIFLLSHHSYLHGTSFNYFSRRMEVLEGVWAWAALPSSEKWAAEGRREGAPDVQIFDSSRADELALFMSPRCAQGRVSELSLRSP